MTMLEKGDQESGVGSQRRTTRTDSAIRRPRPEEHLILEFRDGVFLYVPASKIDLVQKYVGGQQAEPELSKLGGTAGGGRRTRSPRRSATWPPR